MMLLFLAAHASAACAFNLASTTPGASVVSRSAFSPVMTMREAASRCGNRIDVRMLGNAGGSGAFASLVRQFTRPDIVRNARWWPLACSLVESVYERQPGP